VGPAKDATVRRPMEIPLPYRATTGFDSLIGLVIGDGGEDWVSAEVPVREELKQPAGLLHGGVFAAIAESMASLATARAVMADGFSAQGLSNQTSFLRPILEGTIHARAQRRHSGRTTWVWDVEFTDDQGRLCAVTRMTIAVRAARQP
jgi:1,4-dihydroxy-2-naphthoyl-CoA hydrolase